MADYTDKVDALLKHATALGFTEQDFADLALAAADQSGASADEQARIRKILGVPPFAASLTRCPDCNTPTHASESDDDGRCVACMRAAGVEPITEGA